MMNIPMRLHWPCKAGRQFVEDGAVFLPSRLDFSGVAQGFLDSHSLGYVFYMPTDSHTTVSAWQSTL